MDHEFVVYVHEFVVYVLVMTGVVAGVATLCSFIHGRVFGTVYFFIMLGTIICLLRYVDAIVANIHLISWFAVIAALAGFPVMIILVGPLVTYWEWKDDGTITRLCKGR